MAIEFVCPCGAKYSVDDSQAGILFHCDACGLDIPVRAAQVPATPPDGLGEPVGAPLAPLAGAAPDQFADQLAALAAADMGAEEVLPVAEIIEGLPAVKPGQKVSASALAEGLGRGDKTGVADLMAQLGGGAPGAPPAAPRVSPGSVLGPGTPAPVFGPGTPAPVFGPPGAPRTPPKKPPAPKPMTKAQRAAHHLGFKKLVWRPALAMGLLCLGMAVGCVVWYFVKKSAPQAPVTSNAPAGMGGTITKDDKGNEIFEDVRHEVKKRVVYDEAHRAWFVDADALDVKWKNGQPWMVLEGGYEDKGTPADTNNDYQVTRYQSQGAEKAHEEASAKSVRLLYFSPAFFLVGLPLVILALWMRRDIRLVEAKAAEEEAEESAPAVAAAPAAAPATTVPAADATVPAPAVAPIVPAADVPAPAPAVAPIVPAADAPVPAVPAATPASEAPPAAPAAGSSEAPTGK